MNLKPPVAPQIDASLRRLILEHTDAFVFHNLTSMDTFQKLIAPNSGFDQLNECIKAGKTRFRGISSHHPDVLQAAITAGPFLDIRYITEILPLGRSPRLQILPPTC